MLEILLEFDQPPRIQLARHHQDKIFAVQAEMIAIHVHYFGESVNALKDSLFVVRLFEAFQVQFGDTAFLSWNRLKTLANGRRYSIARLPDSPVVESLLDLGR